VRTLEHTVRKLRNQAQMLDARRKHAEEEHEKTKLRLALAESERARAREDHAAIRALHATVSEERAAAAEERAAAAELRRLAIAALEKQLVTTAHCGCQTEEPAESDTSASWDSDSEPVTRLWRHLVRVEFSTVQQRSEIIRWFRESEPPLLRRAERVVDGAPEEDGMGGFTVSAIAVFTEAEDAARFAEAARADKLVVERPSLRGMPGNWLHRQVCRRHVLYDDCADPGCPFDHEPVFPTRKHCLPCRQWLATGDCGYRRSCHYNHPDHLRGAGLVVEHECDVARSAPAPRSGDSPRRVREPAPPLPFEEQTREVWLHPLVVSNDLLFASMAPYIADVHDQLNAFARGDSLASDKPQLHAYSTVRRFQFGKKNGGRGCYSVDGAAVRVYVIVGNNDHDKLPSLLERRLALLSTGKEWVRWGQEP
jgi:hypothetical protein